MAVFTIGIVYWRKMSLYPDPDKKCPICEHKYFDHYYPSQLERHRCVAWAGRETYWRKNAK